MPPRSPFPLLTTPSDSRTATLQGLLIAALVICALYFGREVLLPLALAILLSFVLTPPVLLLRRIKVPRILAVGIVVAIAFGFIFSLGWMMSRQVTDLAADLPRYQTTLSEKIKALRDSLSTSLVMQRAGNVLSNLQNQLSQPNTTPPPEPTVGTEAEKPGEKPIEVIVKQNEPSALEFYQSLAGTLLPPLATAGIVLLLVIFILLQREDLRDRLIRLFGGADLQRATSTMSDAATRLSRYFLSQVLINSAYGTFITLALWWIGLPSPAAWGILAGLMRFVPYVGAYIAAVPPLLIAAAIDPGWTTVLMVLALFIVGEMTMGQVVEPQVFGHGTGVTPIALIASTIFWTWLWGPLGLLIATPMTVCLAVLGRHVEGLEFFDVLLGDEPALTPEQSFYRRMLSGDAAEATYQAELALKEQSLLCYLDTVTLPGLKLAERDAIAGALDKEEIDKVAGTVREMLDDLADFSPRRWFLKLRWKPNHDKEEGNGGLASLHAAEEGLTEAEQEQIKPIDRTELAPGWVVDEQVLCIGGRTSLDEAAAAMLAGVLKKRGLEAKTLPPETISAGHIASLGDTEAKLIVISYLGIGNSPAVIRYVVRRLRRILPEGTPVLVCFWAGAQAPASLKALLDTAEADAYATSLPEAVEICAEFAKGERGKKEVAGTPPSAPVVPAATEITATSAADAAASSGVEAPAAAKSPAPNGPAPKNGKKQQSTPRKPQTASA
jgi:predicted PurR-regulated permease PerM